MICVKIMQISSAADSVWTRTCTSIGKKCVLQTLFLSTKNALSNVNYILWAGHGTGENWQGLELLIRSVKSQEFWFTSLMWWRDFHCIAKSLLSYVCPEETFTAQRLLFHSLEDFNWVFSYNLSNFVSDVSLKISMSTKNRNNWGNCYHTVTT